MKFKCKESGTIIEFLNDYDIKTTQSNPAYEELVEASTVTIDNKVQDNERSISRNKPRSNGKNNSLHSS